jgi:restriction system protein
MTVPTYEKFIEPILRFLAQHSEPVPAKLAHEAAAKALNLSEEDRSEFLASGTQLVYKNRAGWAHDRLKRAGLSSAPKRGFWKITSDGQSFAAQHTSPLSSELTQKLAVGYIGVKLKQPSVLDATQSNIDFVPLNQNALVSPDEQLDQAIYELRKSAASDIQEALSTVSPAFFERIVLELLHAMRYGAKNQTCSNWADQGMQELTESSHLIRWVLKRFTCRQNVGRKP